MKMDMKPQFGKAHTRIEKLVLLGFDIFSKTFNFIIRHYLHVSIFFKKKNIILKLFLAG